MRFRIVRMDRAANLVVEKYKTLSGLIRDYEYHHGSGWCYNENLRLFFDNTSDIKHYFPDEIADRKMKKIPVPELKNYARIFEFEEKGDLPDDLSPAETVLTDLLWGKRNKDMAALLVAALENMDIAEVHDSIREMGIEQ